MLTFIYPMRIDIGKGLKIVLFSLLELYWIKYYKYSENFTNFILSEKFEVIS